MKSLYFFLYGFSSIFIQTYLLRETIFLSGGNEITFGLFFFFWFFGIFFGAITGKKIKGRENIFVFLLSLFPIFSFINYFFVFLINSYIPIQVGSEPNFLRAFFSSFGFSFFVGYFIGLLFPLSLLFQKNLPKIFFFESLGSFFSGFFLTFFLLKFLSPFLGFLILSSLLLFITIKKIKIISIIPLLFIIFQRDFNDIRYKSIGILGNVKKELQSPYQNIIISSLEDTSSIFLNGRFVSQFPSGEAIDLRYFPFFSIPKKCENFLIYGFPMGNENSLKNLNIKKIEIIEPDNFLVDLFVGSEKFYKKEDLRNYLMRTKDKFDLIVLDLPPPNSLLSSRFLTQQFFQIVKKALKKDGYFLLYLNFSQDFWGKEVEEFSSSIYNSIKETFPFVEIGISQNPFFLSSFEKFDLNLSIKRGEELFQDKDNFSPSILRYFFPEEKVKYFKNILKNEKNLKNRDEKPFIYLKILKLKSKLEKNIFIYKIFSISKDYLFLLVILPLFYIKKGKRIYFPVFSNGFIGIGLYLILSFSFQIKYGVFYSKVGFITSLFMLGLAFSSPMANYFYKKKIKIFFIELIFMIYISLLFFINNFSYTIFFIFFFLAGFFSGIPFTFVGLLKGGDQKSSGDVEAQDHLGAAFGAILSGSIFVPLFGIYSTLMIFLILKFYSALINFNRLKI